MKQINHYDEAEMNFSYALNQANLFYSFRTKEYLDPTILRSYPYNTQNLHLFNAKFVHKVTWLNLTGGSCS